MGGKAFLLFLYGVSVFMTLNTWYKNGNSGMPNPSVIAPATYLFALLLLTADFLSGLPVILGAATTVILWERSHPTTSAAPVANTSITKKRLDIGSTKK